MQREILDVISVLDGYCTTNVYSRAAPSRRARGAARGPVATGTSRTVRAGVPPRRRRRRIGRIAAGHTLPSAAWPSCSSSARRFGATPNAAVRVSQAQLEGGGPVAQERRRRLAGAGVALEVRRAGADMQWRAAARRSIGGWTSRSRRRAAASGSRPTRRRRRPAPSPSPPTRGPARRTDGAPLSAGMTPVSRESERHTSRRADSSSPTTGAALASLSSQSSATGANGDGGGLPLAAGQADADHFQRELAAGDGERVGDRIRAVVVVSHARDAARSDASGDERRRGAGTRRRRRSAE